jgi:hypothetical protein
VLIGGEEDAIAISSTVGVVGNQPQAKKIRGRIEEQGVVGTESFSPTHLLGDRAQQRITDACQIDPASHRISLEYRK